MASGGARNRSGPQPRPSSGRSDQRGLSFVALPAEGYCGDAPDFPLADVSAREEQVWAEAWQSPQAAQWARESWRNRSIAMWVRWSVKMESPEAPASIGAVVHRLADTIGMTPAGLRENGWVIAADEVAAKAATKASTTPAKPVRRERRMRAVPGGAS